MSKKENEVLETEAVAEKPIYKELWVWLFAIGAILAIIVNVNAMNNSEEEETTTTTTTTAVSTTVATTEAAVATVPDGAVVEQVDGVWGLYNNGVLVDNYTGLATNSYGTWYIANGIVDFNYNGTATDGTQEYNVTGGEAVPA